MTRTKIASLLGLVLLWPLLILQGRWVRKRTPKLPEPPGPRSGGSDAGQGTRLLVLGDSAAAGVGASSQTEALMGQILTRLAPAELTRWSLHARTGLTTRAAITEANQLPQAQYDIALLVLGVNDVTSPVTSSAWLAQQRELQHLLRTKFGLTHLLVCSLPPMGEFPALPQPLRWFLGTRAQLFAAQLHTELAGRDDVRLLDFDFGANAEDMAADGFHPGPRLYQAMGTLIASAVQTQLRPTDD